MISFESLVFSFELEEIPAAQEWQFLERGRCQAWLTQGWFRGPRLADPSIFWAPGRSLGSSLRLNLFSFQIGKTKGLPTIRGTCAFALNFGAPPQLEIHLSACKIRSKNF